MSKKYIATIIGGITPVLLGVVSLIYFLGEVQTGTNPQTSIAKTIQSTREDPLSSETYTDLSGFSFKYPKEVTIKDTTPDDSTYYTQLDVDKSGNKITIEIRDAQKEPTYQNLIGAATLAGMSAKQYKTEFSQITSAYDKGIVYTVQLHTEDTYMTKVYEDIVSTFTIGNASSGDIVFEEETIE